MDRILYRDGLILVIDKPAGIAVHPGPGAARTLKPALTSCASACRTPRRSPIASIAIPAAASCSAGIRRRCVGWLRCSPSGQVEKIYWAVVDGPANRGRGPDRNRAQKDDSRQRLAHGRRPGRAKGGDRLSGMRRRWRPRLARTAAAHRPHPSIARPLRRARLPRGRRSRLWRSRKPGSARSSTPARSPCRSIPPGRRLKSPPRCRRTCSQHSNGWVTIRRDCLQRRTLPS